MDTQLPSGQSRPGNAASLYAVPFIGGDGGAAGSASPTHENPHFEGAGATALAHTASPGTQGAAGHRFTRRDSVC